MKKQPILNLSVFSCLLIFQGCTTLEQSRPEVPLTREWTITYPVVTPLPQTEELQRHGDISIQVAPVPARFVTDVRCFYSRLSYPLSFLMPNNVSQDTHVYFEEERYTVNALQGSDVRNAVQFLVTITNQMNRVFRGAGALVQFAVDGQNRGIDQSHYEGFVNAMIAPGGQEQINLYGPPLSEFSIQNARTSGVFLYDVVTSVDNAGNVAGRQNFEWFFSVELQQRTDAVTGTRNRVWVTNQTADLITESQANQVYRCF